METQTFSALADPNRLRIVDLLRQGPASVGEIAFELSLRQPQTSKHLRTLSQAGLISVSPQAQRRVYGLRPDPFRAIDRWLESYRPTWDERLDTMEEYLRQLKHGPNT